MSFTVILVTIVIVLLIFAVYAYLVKDKSVYVRCDHCGQVAAVETEREIIASKSIAPTGGFTQSGANLRQRSEVEATLHCGHCDQVSKRRFTLTH